jgi:hypothetical protein
MLEHALYNGIGAFAMMIDLALIFFNYHWQSLSLL